MPSNTVKATFLGQIQSDQQPVYIYLINGIKLEGYILQFDETVIFLRAKTSPESQLQMVYQHAISTVMQVTRQPVQPV